MKVKVGNELEEIKVLIYCKREQVLRAATLTIELNAFNTPIIELEFANGERNVFMKYSDLFNEYAIGTLPINQINDKLSFIQKLIKKLFKL